jgi:arylsulfatase
VRHGSVVPAFAGNLEVSHTFYAPPFSFTGTIHGVTVDISGELSKDDEAALTVLMAR